ncbi:RNA polymerase sigma factor [Actinoplanes sp. SE50]|uniref:RNA polymerase sigma factor n=1 Tax=unclassified Actinoplanes TaxID=2626549 RepID=UPI00023ECB4C|nr:MULTISPECIES: sigma-70 family RNA polymerase sigma factor [unclassified Actinoplanes]AEV85414.1 RNA polymerase sigma factor sigM [Actinoplanes sp. SE50/110]ATO83809.1 RNA polymerase sigma factor [Actinoplanes sp. SE50]SLM01217.1 RNA polymerase sigma factor [Actinoplanes sp. SE50/110]
MAMVSELDFTELYQAHYVDVLRFVRRRASPEDADDIVGETFLTAWRRRADLPPEPRPWLFRTARNIMLNTQRGSRRQQAISIRIAHEPAEPVADAMGPVETRVDLSAAWRELTPRDQETLALHIWEALSDRDAAAVLGCTRATYTMRLMRARRRLARLLGPGAVVSSAATPAPHPTSTLAPTGWEHS